MNDPAAELLTSPTNDKPRLSFTTFNTSLQGNVPQGRTYHKLFKPDKDNWYGNLWIITDIPFPSFRKNKTTKDSLNQLGKITLIINNPDANTPTEVGFFKNNLVRNDTIQSKRHLLNFLPIDCPEYEQVICTLWAGPKNSRRGLGVLKVYSNPQDVSTLSKTFSKTFDDTEHLCFI
jgi:hypothetical protein